jgi:hypothetical protein
MPSVSTFGKNACAALCALAGLMPVAAPAITVEVAKKCNVLLAKEFPPVSRANPAAGSTKGTAQDERDYFKKCVANGGKMDGDGAKGRNSHAHRPAAAARSPHRCFGFDGHKISRHPLFLRIADENKSSLVGHDDVAALER